MTLVAGLIFAGGFVGWIIGHYATNSVAVKTVTVNAAAGSGNATSSSDIAQAPNFSADDLTALPTDSGRRTGVQPPTSATRRSTRSTPPMFPSSRASGGRT